MIADIIYYVAAALMTCITLGWVWLLKSMIESHVRTPRLGAEGASSSRPKVSVIVPARNEEKYIGRCLESLCSQDYPDYEIIAIDDSSEDDTGRIISGYDAVHVEAGPKPEGWMGKNWACEQGCKRAAGELLLFTDSDTRHSTSVITLAVSHMLALNLDALTVMPQMRCNEFWTRVSLPIISVFLHTRFSALRVNDPTKDTGYFFGSFFIIKREVYEKVGGHRGVKSEIIEDGALGRKVKDSGYTMRMVSGYDEVDAIWARDLRTLWDALGRLMIPLYMQSRKIAVGSFFAAAFLLVAPFVSLGVTILAGLEGAGAAALLYSSIAASAAAYAGAAIEARALRLGLRYAVLGPVGGALIVGGFLAGLVRAGGDARVRWRGREYVMRDQRQNPINI